VLSNAEPDGSGTRPHADPHLLMKVIETMTMFEQYVHGYHDQENGRLRDQAGTLADLVHDGITFPAASTVLEAGCGVGAQTVALAQRSPGALITSVDVSPDSVAQAELRTAASGISNVQFAVVDVYDLPHTDGVLAPESFDHIFVCFLLEHLPRPVEALRRLGQMLKPGGTLTVVEGDHGSTYFHPDSDAARDAIACQVTLQRHAGGDALIGRQLYPLLFQAGFDAIRVEPRVVYVDASRPDLVDGFIRKTFTAMIAGVREPAVAAGLITPEDFDQGVIDLERTTEPDGVFCYTFFRAVAVAAADDAPPSQ
jgi:SAM-dependent methyltransferase